MFKSVENEKSLENKAFLRILYFDKKIVKVAEMLENKGFHRTQSKNATELITEMVKIHFGSKMYCKGGNVLNIKK